MGATDVMLSFEHYDFRIGIEEKQKESLEYYGHCEGYSGQIHDISNFQKHFPPSKVLNGDANIIRAYANSRLENIETRSAEYFELGPIYYSIAKPVFKPYLFTSNIPYDIFRGVKEAAVLLQSRGYGGAMFPVARGTVAELKEKAKRHLITEKFKDDYVIVGKNLREPILVTGEGTIVKKTTRTSTKDYLVLPYYRYYVYGLSPI